MSHQLSHQTIREQMEAGNVEIAMHSGRWWKARLNGQTRLWKTRPHEYAIPFKTGLRGYGLLTHEWVEGHHYRLTTSLE